MSSMHRSSVSRETVFKLDANGNIDADKLTKEMTEALAFDIDYKKKDNMKKRAIKSAPDYDAFRNMVACASLKTVSRQEVESLGDKKKGWKKATDGMLSSGGIDTILGQEALEKNKKAGAGALTVEKIKKPKNAMEFNRDWRRLKDSEKKLRYIVTVGPSVCKKLLSSNGDSDFFEEILSFVKDIAYDDSKCDKKGIVEISDDKEPTSSEETMPPSRKKTLNILTLLTELSSIDNFDFMKAMMDKSVLSSVSEWIRSKVVKEEAQNRDGEDTCSFNATVLEELASKYHSLS